MDGPSRRSVTKGLAALMGVPLTQIAGLGSVSANEGKPFSLSKVVEAARRLSNAPYQGPSAVPYPWRALDYDHYRQIQFDTNKALWRGENMPFEAQFFAPGFVHDRFVQIEIVENGMSYPFPFNQESFLIGEKLDTEALGDPMGYSGFRLHTHINTQRFKSEFIVFQGASYFRAVGQGHRYGLSARGLAIDVAEAKGEEFPDFKAFWLEKPEPDDAFMRLHALMDSLSVTGAYSFSVHPGNVTLCRVRATLFPRVALKNVGIAPLTSMFLFDGTNRSHFDDFRPNVHDSDGLLIANGAGEWLWRPLANPTSLQSSNFIDNSPMGFGLMQRKRTFSEYDDIEVRYELRPSAWVEPKGDWGKGGVSLIEIPTHEEIRDNIVAFWRPKVPLMPTQEGIRHEFDLHWSSDLPFDHKLARVAKTRAGKHLHGGRIITVEFDPHRKTDIDLSELSADASGPVGMINQPAILGRNPATRGIRVGVVFEPKDKKQAELRLQLRYRNNPVSEVWLYRWTA